ncbi:MAG: SRPBCC domain-containing protein [Melioribacteraceae bacterium]|nr:SRPBCC domain-containing protein [Melioribacteraceae bacterium]MCO6472557.1 SRPBCC domain-containing protein [Melioribacteraceae bacterium]MDD3558342.1 SRPBCC domain-containing protein [Melioribacteraceae bacterium]
MKKIEKNIIVNAPIQQVFEDVSTSTGTKKFFAPHSKIALTINGKFELSFDIQSFESRFKSSSGMKILSFVPNKMLSFEWKNPKDLKSILEEKTWVTIFLDEVTNMQTKIKLIHIGWKEGNDWDEAFNYFVRFWDIVVFRFKYCYDKGPVDWNNPVYPPHLAGIV